MLTDLQPALEKHPFLENMPPDAMALLTGCARNVHFNEGEELVHSGDEADSFFLVRKGRVTLSTTSSSSELVVASLGPGELVGWSWIIAPYRHRFDARAAEPTVCFELDGKCLRGKCESDPLLGYELLKRVSSTLGHRLDDLQVRLLDVYNASS